MASLQIPEFLSSPQIARKIPDFDKYHRQRSQTSPRNGKPCIAFNPPDPNMSDIKLAPFNIHTTPYKTIHGVDIPAHILIPKSLASNSQPGSRKYPVLVRFHGGYLVSGSALYTEWLPPWCIDFALQNSAILIMPDYRLLPEATGQDILEDLRDFWAWFAGSESTGLLAYLKSLDAGVDVDFEKVAVFGESAGGYLAIRSSLLPRNSWGNAFKGCKAVIASYPMTLLRKDWYSVASETRSPFGAPQLDEGVLDAHIEGFEKGDGSKVVVSAEPPARLDLAIAMVQKGRWTGVFERAGGEGLWLEDVVGEFGGGDPEGGKGAYHLAFHGMGDSAVPWEDTKEWVDIWAEKFGEDRVKGVWRVGMEHGFDNAIDLKDAEGKWLKEELEVVRREWLGA
ncbi:hypothetical protein sscle_01g008310 [Sclerotinia sclerotiorum 1980 UF-70]|uniref:Alpha/beta hydrolase fold-3 domain-containing protein n=1 Tax=Sclerotinia sclerotiorum (strain ATCC 18683 / 1980 / Ss-1) TaxID=665079 RepID=A0A1D9PTK8_SCLS1|nr:hypothetical protein sscle_01g008310 [Sclerotinia sclerotiorum 1980 UF-70]